MYIVYIYYIVYIEKNDAWYADKALLNIQQNYIFKPTTFHKEGRKGEEGGKSKMQIRILEIRKIE